MKVYLCDRNPKMVAEWQRRFDGQEDVEVIHGDIFALPPDKKIDAIVSPANSFGFMDGGIDYVYSCRFGWELSQRLREVLHRHHGGELLVGQAVIVPTGETHIPWLISAPTMRVPMDVADTPNAYLAFRAVLRVVEDHNARCAYGADIGSVLCPGLGTAVGKMPHDKCALQMFRAYKEMYLDDAPPSYDTLEQACQAHFVLLDPEMDFIDWRLKQGGKIP